MLTNLSVSNFPTFPGVYFFTDEKGNILYIGKAKNIQKRVQQYFAPGSIWKQDMLVRACKIDRIETFSEQEALLLEENMIKQYQPEYNRLLKHNTQYTYIRISGDTFPFLTLTRYKKYPDQGATYIGPKRQSRLLHMFLDYVCGLYKLRTCKNTQFMKGKFCAQYDFGLCAGWCKRASFLKCKMKKKATDLSQEIVEQKKNICQKNKNKEEVIKKEVIDEGNIENAKKEYQSALFSIKRFFEGDTSFVCQDILFRIDQAIKTQNFERATRLRDIYRAVHDWTQDQHILFDKPLTGIVCAIKPISTWYVICLLKLFDGKIVDVIRTKEWIHEVDISTLLVEVKAEFGITDELGKRDQEDGMVLYYYIGNDVFSLEEKDKIVTFTKQAIDSFLASDVLGDSSCSIMNHLLSVLQKRYNLIKFPYRIECVDISHFSGEYVSGGIACFIGGIPYYKGYRRYRITGKIGNNVVESKKKHSEKKILQDDYANIYEVITRRFYLWKQEKQEKSTTDNISSDAFPDVFVIDGGRGHLALIRKIFLAYPNANDILRHTSFLALSKGKARKRARIGHNGVYETVYYFDQNFVIHQKKLLYDEADKILIKVRDEAHRFANAYRQKQAESDRKI